MRVDTTRRAFVPLTPLALRRGDGVARSPLRMCSALSAASKCLHYKDLKETLPPAEIAKNMAVVPTWRLNESGTAIAQHFRVRNFAVALDFMNKAGAIAEEENHHPDLAIKNYNQVLLELSTHCVGGLTVNDFIMAAKIDQIEVEKRPLKK